MDNRRILNLFPAMAPPAEKLVTPRLSVEHIVIDLAIEIIIAGSATQIVQTGATEDLIVSAISD